MRLFVAVRPPVEACADLAAALGRDRDPRWHVTLVFLGEQPSPEPFDLRAAADRHQPFPLRLGGFARLGKAVAVGVRGDVEALQRLAHDVRRACRAAGATVPHRVYRPHLTVARDAVPDGLRSYCGPEWVVDTVELVHSVLGRPVTHHVVERFSLASPAPSAGTP